jgi:Flp pilus assembly protein TadD
LFLKAWLVFHSYEIPDNYSFPCIRTFFAPTLWIPFLSFGLLLGPALVAAFLSVRTDPRAAFPAIFGGMYALTVVVFFVFDRYRVPLIPLLALFGARFVTLTVDWLRQRRERALLASAATIVAISIATFIPTPVSRLIDRHQARCLHLAGMSLVDERQFALAIPLLATSAALAPLENESFYNLGVAYQGAEQLPQAREAYERALTIERGHAQANYNLALILLRQGDSARALPLLRQAREGGLHTAGVMGALGQVFASQTNFASAVSAYEEALALDPSDARIRRGLVECLALSGQCARAWDVTNQGRTRELAATIAARCPNVQP